MRCRLPIAAAVLALSTPVFAGPVEDFAAIERDWDAQLVRDNPDYAATLGLGDGTVRLTDPSIAAMDARAAAAGALLARLERVPLAQLPASQATAARILRRQLSETVEANRFGQRTQLFTTYAGWHQGFASLADGLPFRRAADYEGWIRRMELYPAQSDAAIGVVRQAVRGRYTLPCAVLDGHPRTISGLKPADVTQSRYYAPFTRPRPASISEAQWSGLQAQARAAITQHIYPALDRHLAFYERDYRPNCANAVGVSAQPGGAAYYAFRARQETTTDKTPEEIHQIGLSEVARIRAEMTEVARRAGHPSREAMIQAMRTDPRFFARTPEELMQRTARITRRIDGELPKYFRTLPRLPYTIREIPAETAEGTTTAYYNPGSSAAGTAGTYYVNTSKLDQRPLWEIPSLSLHEAVPGHHLQIALQQELDLPRWRRDFTGFTAFVEGWGLYAERLGIPMGLYDTPEADMGRLSYEMWRACRLVVDTGIHAKGWSKDQAIAFMRDNSALTDANIEAEVNRYISWPGQALGYKIGEIAIRAARTRAEAALGDRFDLRDFHAAVLEQGPVPLDVMDAQVDAWIARVRGS